MAWPRIQQHELEALGIPWVLADTTAARVGRRRGIREPSPSTDGQSAAGMAEMRAGPR